MSKRDKRKYKVSEGGKYYCSECGSEMVREETRTAVEMVCPKCGFRNLLYLKKQPKLVKYQIEVVTPWGVEVLKGPEKDDTERNWLRKLIGLRRGFERRVDLLADITYKVFVEGRWDLFEEMRRMEEEMYGKGKRGKGDSNG